MEQTKKIILDPTVQTFVDALEKNPGTPLYELSPEQARNVLNTLQKGPISSPAIDSEDLTLPIGPKGTVTIKIMRPKGNSDTLPVILFMHGAGWVMGGPQTHDHLVREIVHGTQAALVFVDYTLAPEGQYPTAHEEGYAVAKWLAQHGKEHNLDVSRMAIAGDSVGGLMATAIALMIQEKGGPKLAAQVLFYPVTDANFDTPSYQQFAEGPWLTKKAMIWFWDNYVPNKNDRNQPYASPLRASLAQLKKLPITFITTNEFDVLRDEAEAYAHKLMQAGVSVVAYRCLGSIHDSLMLNALANAAVVKATIDNACLFLKKALKV